MKIILAIILLTASLSTYADETNGQYVCSSGDSSIRLPIATTEEGKWATVVVTMSGVNTEAHYFREGLTQIWTFNKKGTLYIELTPDMSATYYDATDGGRRIMSRFRCNFR